jgi:uncharacterized OsmC-like protein
MTRNVSVVAERQAPLRRAYLENSDRARTVKWAGTSNGTATDAFHSVVHIGKGYGVCLRLGIDHAVGGHHDLPNPGDLLCAALAACEDATLRMVADALGVRILDLRVEVDGDVDVRGCLSIDPSVRIGFRSMTCRVHLTVPPGTDPQRLAALRRQAERSCVNLDTLRRGLPVDLGFKIEMGEAMQSESAAT